MISSIFIIGILLSAIFYEFTGLVAGGFIVPPLLALYADAPIKIVAVMVLSLITCGLVNLLSNVTILYGRRRFALTVSLGVLMNVSVEALPVLPAIGLTGNLFVGFMLPGLIASACDKQGIIKTMSSCIFITFALKVVMLFW